MPHRDDAASPLMATMGLVLSALALASVVFVVVRSLQGEEEAAPPIGFVENEDQGSAAVPIAQPDADWRHVEARSSVDARMSLGGMAGLSSTPLPAGRFVPVSPVHRSVAGADVLDFCADGPLPAQATITLRYNDPGGARQALSELSFRLLAPCG